MPKTRSAPVSDSTRTGILYTTLNNALYIPQLNVNLFNRIRHYKAGGKLSHYRLYNRYNQVIGIFNFFITGFFLPLKGIETPKAHILFNNSHTIIQAKKGKLGPSGPNISPRAYPIIIEIPNKSPINKDGYEYIPKSLGLKGENIQ